MGIGWSGLPLIINYFAITLVITSSLYFGFPRKKFGKYFAAAPLILIILLSTAIDIFFIQKRIVESYTIRLNYIAEVIPIYNGNLFTTDYSLFILNDLVGMSKWIAALVFFPLLFGFNSKREQININLLIGTWVSASIANVIVALINSRGYAFSFISRDLSEETGANRFSGLSSHPNHLSTVINLTIPFAFYISKVLKFKKLILFFVPFFLYGQILTGSRIGLVGCITIIVLCLKYLLNLKFFTLIVLAFCGGITLLVVPQLVENFSSGDIRLFSNASGVTQSNYARLSLAKQGIADFLGNPFFGIGPRAFKSSHNIFLQVLASLGIFGFAAFTFLLIRVFFTRTKITELLIASRLSFASVLISGLFSNALADFFLYLPVSVILGSLSRNSDRESGGVN